MTERKEPDTKPASLRPSKARIRFAVASAVFLVLVISAVWAVRSPKTGDLTINTQRFTAIVPSSRERDARAILDYLEQESARIEGVFDLAPANRPLVHMYSGSDFPSSTTWHVGMYSPESNALHVSLDPRGSGTPRDEMKMVAVHEYAHILIELRGGHGIPTWIREGVAQYFCGQYKSFNERVSHDQKVRLAAFFIPLNQVSTSVNVPVGYPESAFVAAYLAHAEGEDSLISLLASLSSGKSVEESLLSIYSVEEDDLVEKTREWITQ